MKYLKSIVFCFLLGASLITYGQAEFDIDLSGNCSYYGEKIEDKIYGFTSSQEAVNIIENLLSQVGLKKNFEIMAANVPNAAAVIQGSTRYILYSQNFISKVNNSTGSEWASISILAHEIGHHLNGHTLESTGSRPPIELEADEFSGFVLAKMGASLNEAQLAMSTLASNTGSSTHPGKSARLEAIAVGWNKASSTGSRNTANTGSSSSQNTSTNTPPSIPTTTNNQVQFISKCVFPGDNHIYYITNTNLILSYNPYTNYSQFIGQKQASSNPNFAWVYATSTVRYWVDFSGKIWSQNNFGHFFQVGSVVSP